MRLPSARVLAAGRVAVGATLVVAPRLASVWAGDDAHRPAVQTLTRALGVRDLALGVGALVSANPTPWLVWGALSDGVDVAATALAWKHLPPTKVAIAAVASGATALGVVAAVRSRR